MEELNKEGNLEPSKPEESNISQSPVGSPNSTNSTDSFHSPDSTTPISSPESLNSTNSTNTLKQIVFHRPTAVDQTEHPVIMLLPP